MTAPVVPYVLMLKDEVPAIGSGQRFVFVREGRKWAYVLCPFTITTSRIRMWEWEKIKREPWWPRVTTVKTMRKRLAQAMREPTRFERAALAVVEGRW